MEKGKQVGGSSSSSSSSSSSFTNDLFGSNKESVQSSGTISSLFPPPSSVLGVRSNSLADQLTDRNKQYYSVNPVGNKGIAEDASKNREGEKYCASSKSEPCPLSSSLYYGGQEDMYVRSSNNTNPAPYLDVKKGGGGDKNGDDPNIASRGDWWEGSLYY